MWIFYDYCDFGGWSEKKFLIFRFSCETYFSLILPIALQNLETDARRQSGKAKVDNEESTKQRVILRMQ